MCINDPHWIFFVAKQFSRRKNLIKIHVLYSINENNRYGFQINTD